MCIKEKERERMQVNAIHMCVYVCVNEEFMRAREPERERERESFTLKSVKEF